MEMGAVNNQLDNWKFKFNTILHNATQDDVYDQTASQIVNSAVAGYNGTVMCYGQTGAGKTFTMLGQTNNYKNRGIIPRAIQQVYHEISSKFDQAVTIRVSYVEIYNERVSSHFEGSNMYILDGWSIGSTWEHRSPGQVTVDSRRHERWSGS